MSHRPRLAGDGRLRLPASASLDNEGVLRGTFGSDPVDPFDWTDERLLVAESFARLDLADLPGVEEWWRHYGAVEIEAFTDPAKEVRDPDAERVPPKPNDELADDLMVDVTEERRAVRWHIATLLRLSETRVARDWDAAWGRLVLIGPERYRWVLGASVPGAFLDSFIGAAHDPDVEARLPRRIVEREAIARATRDWPHLRMRGSQWFGYWDDEPRPAEFGPSQVSLRPELAGLGTTWDSALALERVLLAPYVTTAIEGHFRIDLEPGPDGRTRVVPHDERVWTSVLAPIYLQLFEALRRISEGEPGAARCRECGQPFLVLDGRRRFFCNERERDRFAQRERRVRLALQDQVATSDAVSAVVTRGDGRMGS